MRCTQEILPEIGCQRCAKEYEYYGQQRSRKREAEEEGDNRRLCWAGSKESANLIVEENVTNKGWSGVRHTVILDPTEAGLDFVDGANCTRFRAVEPLEDAGGGVELPED